MTSADMWKEDAFGKIKNLKEDLLVLSDVIENSRDGKLNFYEAEDICSYLVTMQTLLDAAFVEVSRYSL